MPDRSPSLVLIAGAALALAGAVLALSGLVVFVDWIVGVANGAFASRAFCPPEHRSWCMAASAQAGVLGLLVAGVGVLGTPQGVRLLPKSRAVSSMKTEAQAAN